MENQRIVEQIIHGMDHYMEVLALPAHMEKYDDGICAWIKPRAKGTEGPAAVYKVYFGDKTDEQIREIIQSYRAVGVPDYWDVTPLSTPGRIKDLLISLDVMKQSSEGVVGMALLPEEYVPQTKSTTGISARKANGREDFKIWTDIANEALHGCRLLDPELYYPVCESGEMTCFLGYSGETPVATSSAMMHDGNGTLEFIATLPDYRKRGIGACVCRAAIEQLIGDSVSIITLRAREMGVSLYTSLGFKQYFLF
jgi:GNAT superfamily N-acetyltransferase